MEGNKKILIVEDEILICKDLKDQLKHLGVEQVEYALDCEEARTKFYNFNPDLILMDIKLGDEYSGIDLANEFVSKKDIPIIYVTAYSDFSTFRLALHSEPYAYLTKPIKNVDLRYSIEVAFYKHKMHLRLKEREQKLRSLFENASDGIISIDEEGKIKSVNNSFKKIFNLKDLNPIGLHYKVFLPNLQINENQFNLGTSRSKEAANFVFETKGLKETGDIFDCEAALSKLEIENIEDKLYLFIRDITAKKNYERLLTQTNKELEERIIERTKIISSLTRQAPMPIAILNEKYELIEANIKWTSFYSKLGSFVPSKYNLFSDPIVIKNNLSEEIIKNIQVNGEYKSKAIYVDLKDYDKTSEEDFHLISFNVYAIKDSSKNILRVIAVIQDHTDMLKIQEAVDKIKRQKEIISEIFGRVEIEKERISKDLHDSVAQLLYAAKLNLEMFEIEAKVLSPKLSAAKSLIAQALDEIRNIISDYRPEELEKFGLKKAINRLLDNLKRALNCSIIADTESLSQRFERKKEIYIYRIFQEALSNIANHSNAKMALIETKILDNILFIKIQDDGKGFSFSTFDDLDSECFGLKNIKERAENLGGKIEIETKPGEGTKLFIQIPILESRKIENGM